MLLKYVCCANLCLYVKSLKIPRRWCGQSVNNVPLKLTCASVCLQPLFDVLWAGWKIRPECRDHMFHFLWLLVNRRRDSFCTSSQRLDHSPFVSNRMVRSLSFTTLHKAGFTSMGFQHPGASFMLFFLRRMEGKKASSDNKAFVLTSVPHLAEMFITGLEPRFVM